MITPDVHCSLYINSDRIAVFRFLNEYVVDNWFLAGEITDFHYQWINRTRSVLLFLVDCAQPKKFSVMIQRVRHFSNNTVSVICSLRQRCQETSFQKRGGGGGGGEEDDSGRIVQKTETPHRISTLVGSYSIQHRLSN